MNRRAVLAVAGWAMLVLADSALACRIPIIRPHPIPPSEPPPPRVDPILTRMHKADIRVQGAVAKVDVSATFYNPNGFRAEGTYFFPIEADAVVRDFTMTVNGKEQKAELLDAAKARQIYEEIVRKQKDPGLLEYVGTRMLKARVFPIEPRSEIAVKLTYHQVVKADAGLFRLRYPLASAKPNEGKVDEVAVRVSLESEAPVKLFYSPSHKIDTVRKDDRTVTGGFEQSRSVPDRDFEVTWSVGGADLGVSVAAFRPRDEDGYCLLALSPRVEVEAARVEPKDIVFVFDKSGSMAGDKMQQAKRALSYCLERLNPKDRFDLIAFGTDVESLTGGLVEAARETVRAAREKLDRVEARGGTAIYDAVTAACRSVAGSPRLAMVVFLTDGKPTIGSTDIEEILSASKKENRTKARFFVFGVGSDLNTDLLDRLATEHRGAQEYVSEREDIEVKVSGFYDKVAQPVLTDVAVEVDGLKLRDVYPRQLPDLFRGGQVLLFGRYAGGGKHSVVVRGKAAGKEQVVEANADFDGSERNGFLPAIWAHRKVAFLLEEIRLRGHNKELEDEIVSLGKRHGIMTPYTSFLIVEDNAPERRELSAFRRSFEEAKSGADGVRFSRGLAGAKSLNTAPAASAAPEAFDFGGWRGRAGEGGGERGGGLRERMRQVADKVFYLAADGLYYDSRFEEKDRGRIVEIKVLSDEYFELLNRHPRIGPYLAAKFPMVLCVEGQVYRIRE